MKRTFWQRAGDFLARRGFYIALTACLLGIGASGWFLFSSLSPNAQAGASVSGVPAQSSVSSDMEQALTPSVSSAAAPEKPADSAGADQDNLTDEEAAADLEVISYTWPVHGEVLTAYCEDALTYNSTLGDWRVHNGVDIAADVGTKVVAAASGTVTDVYDDPLLGTTVVLDHGDGLVSRYGNLELTPTVVVGDTVLCGAVLGSVGATAAGEEELAPHLHFEMLSAGLQVDPAEYLPAN